MLVVRWSDKWQLPWGVLIRAKQDAAVSSSVNEVDSGATVGMAFDRHGIADQVDRSTLTATLALERSPLVLDQHDGFMPVHGKDGGSAGGATIQVLDHSGPPRMGGSVWKPQLV
jgi:hypothetical protein